MNVRSIKLRARIRKGLNSRLTITDVAAFFTGIGRSTAGEGGHAALKRWTWRKATRL
jgi:hypothetical protein